MQTPKRFVEFTVGIQPRDHKRLLQVAREKKLTRRELVRQAILAYLDDYDKAPNREAEAVLAARLHKLENRLADLTVITCRASAQTLYLLTLPYLKGGFPQKPLKEEVFRREWQKSRSFASEFLKNARIEPIETSEAQNPDQQS